MNDEVKAKDNNPKRVAVLYDFQNMSKSADDVAAFVRQIFAEARKFGEVVKENFAFVKTGTSQTAQDKLRRSGFYVVCCPSLKPYGKDTCDETLMMFADMLLEMRIDVFVVVSNDGDFNHVKVTVENRRRKFVPFHLDTVNKTLIPEGGENVNLKNIPPASPPHQPPTRRKQRRSTSDKKVLAGPDQLVSGNDAREPPTILAQQHKDTVDITLTDGYYPNKTLEMPVRTNLPANLIINENTELPRPSPVDSNRYYFLLLELVCGYRRRKTGGEWEFLEAIIEVLESSNLSSTQYADRKSFPQILSIVIESEQMQKFYGCSTLQDFVDALSALARSDIEILQTRTSGDGSCKYYVFRDKNPLIEYFKQEHGIDY